MAPLAPDLKQQGLNWHFVQHDMRRAPWPFDDATFDFIMCKDMSLAVPTGTPTQRVIDECIRLLRTGGVLEIWESDYTVRSIQPHQQSAVRQDEWEQRIAKETATFPMSPATPFAPTQNRFLKSANAWIDQALEVYKLPSAPCTRIAPMLLQEPENLGDISFRRIAVPLGQLRWERKLDSEQLAVREAAQLVITGLIDSLEPVLRQASGKNAEEWSYWWAGMLASLSSPKDQFCAGECLELGAWWATKLGDDDSDDC
ncbi:hypothetical protein AMS68_006586 [Peltaster fructicola]|uniref:Methyltransferase domain-containing protein n=1 Tax=Peltaster fructicola TaxID=286661 RepID=A0A6H0Y2I9_9PEZI|nr:hypothetical protein AMS68_006586 [Peltaster fructicola]